jgi:hypothetical protein
MALTSGFAVTPWTMTLNRTVPPATAMIVSLPGSFSLKTITRKTGGGEPARAEPADEQLIRKAQAGAGKAPQHRHHADRRQAQHRVEQRRVEQRRPGETGDDRGERADAERDPG